MLFHDIFQLLWSIVSLSVILAILWFIVRRIIKGGANNKNRELLFVIALGACLQGCSSFEEKRLDPVPVPIVKSHDDVDLGEVVVIGRREILLPIANYVGLDETGFGSDYSIGGGGGGGGGGAPSGSGGSGGTGIPNEEEGSGPGDGTIAVMRFQTKDPLVTLNVLVKIENGTITDVKTYYSGLTVGSNYNQDLWSQTSHLGNNYNFEFIFHTDYSLFLEGLGTLGSGQPIRASVVYNATTGASTLTYSIH